MQQDVAESIAEHWKTAAASSHGGQAAPGPGQPHGQALARSHQARFGAKEYQNSQARGINRPSSRKEGGIWKLTAAIRAVCEINASNKATQTNYNSPLPRSALPNTEKQRGFLFGNPPALMFFQIINISFHSLCCLQRSGLQTGVERRPALTVFPTSPSPTASPHTGSGWPPTHRPCRAPRG